jgi:hypothetical protein
VPIMLSPDLIDPEDLIMNGDFIAAGRRLIPW